MTDVPYDDEDEDWPFEYQASFEGTCTCLDICSAKDEPEKHGWGSCDDPNEVGCNCRAGWCE